MKRIQDRWKCVCKSFGQIFMYTLFLLLLPLLIFILALLWGYKHGILRLVVKHFKPKLLENLTPTESLYASDPFWEDSRSSSALVLILNGNITLEQIRQDFLNHVVLANASAEGFDDCGVKKKLFPRLTQIPVSFGGYYFWQAASYFLIHEHIRPIKTWTDEGGLKKFAGTVLTLPYPNKRPLWEILVFSSYGAEKESQGEDGQIEESLGEVKSKCSALVVRMHASIGDFDTMMKMIACLCNGNRGSYNSLVKLDSANSVKGSCSSHSLKLPDCISHATMSESESKCSLPSVPWCSLPKCPGQSQFKSEEQESISTSSSNSVVLNKIRNLLKAPKNVHSFFQGLLRNSSTSLENIYSSDANSPTTVSWGSLNYSAISKVVKLHGVQRCGLLVSTLIDALATGLPLLEINHAESPDLEGNHNDKNQPNFVPLSIMCSSMESASDPDKEHYCDKDNFYNRQGFSFLQSCGEGERLERLAKINDQLIQEVGRRWIYKYWLRLLNLFPHRFTRTVNFSWIRPTIIFQEGKTDLCQLLREGRQRQMQQQSQQMSLTRVSEVQDNDLIFIEDHQLMDVIPVMGLMFRQTVIAGSAIKFQNAIKISVTINPALMPEQISTMPRTLSIGRNSIIDKQARADGIVANLGLKLDKILLDAKDEHGFVRIPVTM